MKFKELFERSSESCGLAGRLQNASATGQFTAEKYSAIRTGK